MARRRFHGDASHPYLDRNGAIEFLLPYGTGRGEFLIFKLPRTGTIGTTNPIAIYWLDLQADDLAREMWERLPDSGGSSYDFDAAVAAASGRQRRR